MLVNKWLTILVALTCVVLSITGCSFESIVTQSASAETPEIIFFDNFDDPSSGWEESIQGGIKGYYEGTYHIRIESANFFSWSVAKQSLGDAFIEVDVAFTGTAELAEMGIICRMQNSLDFYFFTIRSDGGYAIFRMYQGNESFIGMEGYQFSPAINVGLSTNHIGALCYGNQLSLFANGQNLITVEDSNYQLGDVGVIVGAFDEANVSVFFDNFKVTKP